MFFCGFLHALLCSNDWAVPNYIYRPTAATYSNPFYQTLNLFILRPIYHPSKGSQALMGPVPFLASVTAQRASQILGLNTTYSKFKNKLKSIYYSQSAFVPIQEKIWHYFFSTVLLQLHYCMHKGTKMFNSLKINKYTSKTLF
jgi:hypothetical protein